MKVTIIGGGAWGVTLGLVLTDNNHDVLIYDIKSTSIDAINSGIHPVFKTALANNIKGTVNLLEALNYSEYLILAIPTKYTRETLKEINKLLRSKKVFINVSKGIEPSTLKSVGQIVKEEINEEYYRGYVVLTGPSHAEELVVRKLTMLVSASDDYSLSTKVQKMFSNDKYLRVYTSSDQIGAEVGGAVKNAIAVVSGIITGLGLGENARAALLTRGILEIIKVVVELGGNRETAFGLTGIGDLIVTALSDNSRNFRAGKKIGQGITLEKIYEEEKETIEGFRSIEALYSLSQKRNIELPIINEAFLVVFRGKDAKVAISSLLNRRLKSE